MAEIVQEMLAVRDFGAPGRVIDHDERPRMEKKKREGYF